MTVFDDVKGKTKDELHQLIIDTPDHQFEARAALMELQYRQIQASIDAAEATAQTARWQKWSTIFLVASIAVSLIVPFLTKC